MVYLEFPLSNTLHISDLRSHSLVAIFDKILDVRNTLGLANSVSPDAAFFPCPLPINFVLGLDDQQCEFESEHEGIRAYGKHMDEFPLWYYMYLLSVKVPVGTCLLFIAALTQLPKQRRYMDAAFVMVPAIMFITIVSIKQGPAGHFRYVLLVLPFVFIFSSGIFTRLHPLNLTLCSYSLHARLACIALVLVEHAFVFPHGLSYCSLAYGGPRNASVFLSGSSLYWGQDSTRVEDRARDFNFDGKVCTISDPEVIRHALLKEESFRSLTCDNLDSSDKSSRFIAIELDALQRALDCGICRAIVTLRSRIKSFAPKALIHEVSYGLVLVELTQAPTEMAVGRVVVKCFPLF